MNYSAVLFDLDGTLIDSNELIFKSFEYTFAKVLQKEVPREEIARTFGRPLVEVMPEFSEEKADLLLEGFLEYNLDNHDEEVKIFPQVKETMATLRERGLKIAIVTSKRRHSAEKGITLFDLTPYVDILVTPEMTTQHKPHPEPAIYALEELGVTAEETLMVGDSSHDILCGKQAGCQTVLVSYSIIDTQELLATEPDYVIHTMEELLSIIEAGK